RRRTHATADNIAEAAGRVCEADSARHYAIARGSAMECAAIIDALYVIRVVDEREQQEAADPPRSGLSPCRRSCVARSSPSPSPSTFTSTSTRDIHSPLMEIGSRTRLWMRTRRGHDSSAGAERAPGADDGPARPAAKAVLIGGTERHLTRKTRGRF